MRAVIGRWTPLPACLLAVLLALTVAAKATAAENPAGQPPFGAEPLAPLTEIEDLDRRPPGFRLSAGEAISIAAADETIVAERAESPAMEPVVSTRGDDRWQVDYFVDRDAPPVAQAVIADSSGTVLEAWRDHQVEVKLARGYDGAVAGIVSSPWIWLPLCLIFFLPFFDPRRPFRLLHLDLLVLLGLSLSLLFFNLGEIEVSVPVVYPVLAYFLVRMTIAGLRPRAADDPLVPLIPIRALLVLAAVLLLGRIALNLADSQVIDIGFANVVGADRIAGGQDIYAGQFTSLIDRGDSYGPFSYLVYVPFEALLPWGGGLEPLPAAHAAAIVFDLIVVALLFVLGRRLREGAEGRALGTALAFAWVACPFTLYALDSNGGNDTLLAALLIAALLAFASPLGRGLAIGLGAAAKFGPLALAPLFAAGPGGRRVRDTILFGAAFVAIWALLLLPLLPGPGLDGLREFYDRTFGYQASRGSPFSVWGLAPSLGWAQDVVRALPILAGIAAYFLPWRRTAVQAAALGAALLILAQLGSMHWFYFFVVWWLPYVLVVSFSEQRRIEPTP